MTKAEIGFTRFIKIAAVLCFIIFLYCIYLKYQYSPDDTFIYLKYSQNLATGNNFSFNKGEPSYGVTGPLWAVMLALPFLLGIDAFWFAKSLDLLCILCSFIVFYRVTAYFFKDNPCLRLLALIIFMINPWIIRSAFTGMETSLAILLVILLFYFYYTNRFIPLFVLTGASILVRPEMTVLFIIFISLTVIASLKQNNRYIRHSILYLCCTLVIIVPYWIFSYLNFGTIFSNTSLGKSVRTADLTVLMLQAKEIIRIFIMVGPIETVLALIMLIIILVKKKLYGFAPMLAWVLGLLFLYIMSTTAVMARYYLILYPFVVVLCVYVINQISFRQKLIITVLVIVIIIYSQFIFYRYLVPYTNGFTHGMNTCLIPLGKWLNLNTPQGSRILVNDVGAIGFYSDRYIIDAAALINSDLNLNKKILSVPNTEKEYPHLMLNFINADYLVEKDTVIIEPLKEAYNYKLEAVQTFVFSQMWVLDSNPKYFTIYKLKPKSE